MIWDSVKLKLIISGHSKRRPKMVFKTDYSLMWVNSIAECSKGSILQYFRTALSYHLSLRSLFCLFLSGLLRQVLLYYLFIPVHEILEFIALFSNKDSMGAQWLSGRVLDLRSRGCGFDPHWHHCVVSLSKTH